MEREKSVSSTTSFILARNVACPTVHGFGQDVEWAGEKTLDAANAVKKKL
jgi:predicted small secreted protein